MKNIKNISLISSPVSRTDSSQRKIALISSILSLLRWRIIILPFVMLFAGNTGLLAQARPFVWLSQATELANATEQGQGVAVDALGNVCVTGNFSGTIQFGNTILTNTSAYDAFVVAYDPSGNVLWANQSVGGGAFGYGVAFDAYGNSCVVGSCGNETSFGTNTPGGNTMFVVKYDPEGNMLWVTFLPLGSDGEGIALDVFGNCYVSGSKVAYSSGTAKISSSGVPQWTNTTSGGYGIGVDILGNSYVGDTSGFLSKIDGDNGASIWRRNVSNSIYAVATDIIGSSYITGPGSPPFYLAKYNSAGGMDWVQTVDDAIGRGVAVDGLRRVFVTGAQSGNVFVVAYDRLGTLLWTKSTGGSSGDNGAFGIAVKDDALYVTGQCQSGVTFDTFTATNAGPRSMFVSKISLCPCTDDGGNFEHGDQKIKVDGVNRIFLP